jgi:enoyl-CoA hydratase
LKLPRFFDLTSVSAIYKQLFMGLVNRLVVPGQALAAALTLANDLAQVPQQGLRSDRLSSYEQ